MRTQRRVPIEALIAIALALVLGCSDPSFASSPLVYQCQREGVRVFSDRPCGADARPQRVAVAVAPASAAPVPAPRATPTAAKRSAPAPHAAQRAPPRPRAKTTQCHDLQRDIDAIDTRMRLGYRGKEGLKLDARRRAATERYRQLRCNTTAVRAPPSTR
jgi:hypothetical protein